MKILHFSDLHLGVESYGRIDPATGLSSRLLDFLSALDQVVDFAAGENKTAPLAERDNLFHVNLCRLRHLLSLLKTSTGRHYQVVLQTRRMA